MTTEPISDAQLQQFMMQAAVTLADSCTMPKLTPSCPFYRVENDMATCEEQCRLVAGSFGAPERPVARHRVGGLVMKGREIPLEIAGGAEDFDATRDFIQNRHLPPGEQSTTSLLLGLRSLSTSSLLGEPKGDVALDRIWRQLEQRHFPVARVAAAGLSRVLAEVAASRAITPRLRQLGLLETLSTESTHWFDFMLEAKESLDNAHPLSPRNRAYTNIQFRLPAELQQINDDGSLTGAFSNDEVLRFAFGSRFISALGQWFGRLIADKPGIAFNDAVPDLALFGSLPRSPFREDLGQWLWDRFTVTDIRSWAPVSQAYEWNWLVNEEHHAVPKRILRERPTKIEEVSNAYFQAMLSRRLPSAAPSFDATGFAREAANRLTEGKAKEAAEIFRGITELRPTDTEAWNNLGFCLLSLDPEEALHALGRASMFARKRSHVHLANHLLALHLLGRDEDALILADEDTVTQKNADSAWVWEHSQRRNAGTLVLVDDVAQYLADLIAHIRGHGCV